MILLFEVLDKVEIDMNKVFNVNCMDYMVNINDVSVDFTLTDIPYNAVNRQSNGLRTLDKDKADVLTFDLNEFLENVYRVTKNSIVIFCGKEQFSEIFTFFTNKKGTVRPIIWEKSNPSPMNGQYVYLSGVEMAVWFKRSGAKTFNAHCKNTVFKFPNGRSKQHPTEKNHLLLKELILDNTNEQDIVFDPCAGSGSHLLVAKQLNRQYLGCEIDNNYFDLVYKRLTE